MSFVKKQNTERKRRSYIEEPGISLDVEFLDIIHSIFLLN